MRNLRTLPAPRPSAKKLTPAQLGAQLGDAVDRARMIAARLERRATRIRERIADVAVAAVVAPVHEPHDAEAEQRRVDEALLFIAHVDQLERIGL